MKIKLPKPKSLKKELDTLWSECIKARAGYKSEISGSTENLQSHHISGKDCYRLRWELDNGICLTKQEHIYGVHAAHKAYSIMMKIKFLRGEDIYERMEELRQYKVKVDLKLVKIYLQAELTRLQNL